MSEPVLTSKEALKWFENASNNWRKLLSANPDILSISCDIANSVTVAQVLQHIVGAELRWAERIARLPETDFGQIPFGSVDAIYATHDRALDIYHQSLAADLDWDQIIDFITRSLGPGSASRKALESRTASDLFATSGVGSVSRKFYERSFTNFHFALNWHASPDST